MPYLLCRKRKGEGRGSEMGRMGGNRKHGNGKAGKEHKGGI